MVKWLFKRPDLPMVICLAPAICGRLVEPLTKEDTPFGWRITIRTPSLARGKRIILNNIHRDWLVSIGFVPEMNSEVFYLIKGPGGKSMPSDLGLQYIEDPQKAVEDRDMSIVSDKLSQEERDFSLKRLEKTMQRGAKIAEIMRKKEQAQEDKYGRHRGQSDTGDI